MIKVTYSSDISQSVGVGGEIVKSASEMRKQASTIFRCGYDQLKPPDGMTGIHLVALGDSEAYPMNRNGDLFPKEACVKYHDTFVKYGHVFQHHRNKDPEKAIGQIKAAAYNPDMHRIELYIWADNEKARDHLDRLEKTGEVSFSMAAKVPFDRCSCCGAIRKQAGDENECDHVKYSLGKIAEDGSQIGTYNDEPTWFDISFVGRPADRIAWSLKVASGMPEDIPICSSVKRAEIEGYVLPDDLVIESDLAVRKLGIMKKLAGAYSRMDSWIFGGAKPSGAREAYEFELRKLAGARLDGETLSSLRALDPSDAFAALGNAGVILDAESFLKYAFGPEYGKVVRYAGHVARRVPGIITEAVKTASCAGFCNCASYDPSCPLALSSPVPGPIREALSKSASAGGFSAWDAVTGILSAMASGECPQFVRMEKSADADADGEVSAVADRLARRYAMYKVAALAAALSGPACAGIREDDVIAIAAAQDMVSPSAS